MALRQVIWKFTIPLRSYTSSKLGGITSIKAGDSKNNLLKLGIASFIKEKEQNNGLTVLCKTEEKLSSPQHGNSFIDLFTNNPYKRLYMPTIAVNTLKVYQDVNNLQKSIKDNREKVEIKDPLTFEKNIRKEAVRMLRIRRRKMKKHKRERLRKKMKFVFAKIRMMRDLRKEQIFRTELLTQVEAADKFDAKEYVENILHTLRYHPKPETDKEKREKYRLKMKAHRYQTTFIYPKFDDV